MKAYGEVDQKTSKQILFLLLITKYLQKEDERKGSEATLYASICNASGSC